MSLWIKNLKEFENTHGPHFACVLIVYGKGVRLLYISVKNHDTHTETSKFIYKALTLHGKQFLLKRDELRSHKSIDSSV